MKKVLKKIGSFFNKDSIFYTLTIIGLILALYYIIQSKGAYWTRIIHINKSDTFMDYYNMISTFNFGNPYELRIIYPPLSMLILKFLYALIEPAQLGLMEGSFVRNDFSANITFIILIIVSLSSLSCCIMSSFKEKKLAGLKTMLFMISLPIICCIQRGNTVMLAISFSFMFFLLKDSRNKYLRELSLICLAVAFGIKLYPALFGLELLLEKRWKEAIRCSIYGLLLFFGPLVFFGGFSSMKSMMAIIVRGILSGSGYGYGGSIYLPSITKIIGSILNIKIIPVFNLFLESIIGLITLFVYLTSKNVWKRIVLIVFVIAVLLPSGFYSIAYLFIPIIMYLNGKNHSYLYSILFSILLVPFLFVDDGELILKYDKIYFGLTYIVDFCVLLILAVVIWWEKIFLKKD